ncbi:hypothetical protein TNCV_1491481 [Trichonephila clavipes]|nr:hypothetical protein TNCV_1491481 [Trichonephila clavipes]
MHVWVSVYKETDQMLLFSRSDCKEQLPAPGNRSNERRDRKRRIWQRQRKKARNERGEGEEKSRGREK